MQKREREKSNKQKKERKKEKKKERKQERKKEIGTANFNRERNATRKRRLCRIRVSSPKQSACPESFETSDIFRSHFAQIVLATTKVQGKTSGKKILRNAAKRRNASDRLE